MTQTAYITDPNVMNRIIADATIRGDGFHAELFSAARRGALDFCLIDAVANIPKSMLRPRVVPLVVSLNDAPFPAGPEACASSRQLLAWARYAAIIAVTPRVTDAVGFIDLANRHRALLLVETSPSCASAWALAMTQRRPRALNCVAMLPNVQGS